MSGKVQYVLKDRSAIAAWVFIFLWISALTAFSWIYYRDGGFHQFGSREELGILVVFWLFGLGSAKVLLDQPLVTLHVDYFQAILTEKTLFHQKTHRLTAADMKTLLIEKTIDSEGDDIFALTLTRNGRCHVLCRKSNRDALEEISSQIRKAFGDF